MIISLHEIFCQHTEIHNLEEINANNDVLSNCLMYSKHGCGLNVNGVMESLDEKTSYTSIEVQNPEKTKDECLKNVFSSFFSGGFFI